MKLGILLPGQGFQRAGVLAGLIKSHPKVIGPILEEIDSTLPSLRLSTALTDSEFRGPITPTSVAQPLILSASYAIFQTFEPSIPIKYVMGHSLGEITALAVSGVLSFSDALELVRQRGLAMENAASSGTGMTAIVKPRKGADNWSEQLEEVAYANSVDIANYNSSAQTVLSGDLVNLRNAVESLQKWHRRLITKQLDVSGAFHSRHMKPAQPALDDLSRRLELREPKWEIVSNSTARPFESLDEIRTSIPQMLVSPVKWQQSCEYLSNNVEKIVSIGPGRIGKMTASEYKTETEYYE